MAAWEDNPIYKKAASFAQVSQKEIDRVSRELLPKAAQVARHIPFAEDATAAYFAAIDPDVASTSRAMIWGPLLYFVLPIDAIPDIIPGAGFLDDAALIAMMLKAVSSAIKPSHRNRARDVLGLPARAIET